MSVHKIERHVIPDMQAVHDQIEKELQWLEMMVDALKLCHRVDQSRLTIAEYLLSGVRRELLHSLRDK